MNDSSTTNYFLNIGKQIIMFSISCLIIFSCKTSNKKEVQVLKSSLQSLLNENQELVNELKIRKNSSASVEPYYTLANSLNELIIDFCDTGLVFIEPKNIGERIKTLNLKYHHVIDSIKKSYSFKLFLPADDSLITTTEFNEIITSSGDENIDCYLSFQDIILKHRRTIRTFQYSISVCYLWFTKFDDLGYSVNVSKGVDVCNIEIHYDYPKRYAEYNLIGLERLESADKNEIDVKEVVTTLNDTLKFVIKTNHSRNIKAFLKYKVIKCTGELDTIVVEMPFTIK